MCAAGKVHGSLARAGKVRGQTPKVQKQDKKKQPKGRAMKRIKYNRRFVNVGELHSSWGMAYTALGNRTYFLSVHMAAFLHCLSSWRDASWL